MSEEIIEDPTYMKHVRHFFEEIDLAHMHHEGIDLSTYDALRKRSTDVYFQTLNANMPPEPERKWSDERSKSLKNWITNDHPFGEPSLQQVKSSNAKRIRKDASLLNKDELAKLAKAFHGLMSRKPNDPNSYFALAGIHWYPEPSWCKHHQDHYNPWHRAYLYKFEDALRTVEGCEDVTLAYWDITVPPPSFLYQEPFASYTLPTEVHASYPAGYKTERYAAEKIAQRVKDGDIPGIIASAMIQPVWGDFVTFTGKGIEAAHDSGHEACGPTLTNTDVAAFDPLFWFFHSNWDRLWWEWQQIMSATTLWTFRSTIRGSTIFLEPPFNKLEPFSLTADKTINLNDMGIGYEVQSRLSAKSMVERGGFGSLAARGGVHVKALPEASVRLKGIDRLKIPGSFRAILNADGHTIGRRTFFQSTEPWECDNCRDKAIINLDFIVPLDAITGKELAVKIEVLTPNPEFDARIPLHACGNPTLNVRLLLQEK